MASVVVAVMERTRARRFEKDGIFFLIFGFFWFFWGR